MLATNDCCATSTTPGLTNTDSRVNPAVSDHPLE